MLAASAAWLALPAAYRAQADTRVRRVGCIVGANREDAFGSVEALEEGMRHLGYVEGQNLSWERRFGGGRYDRLPALASELVAKGVEVIVSGGTPSTRAAIAATRQIPIIFVGVSDPIASGFVKSLAKPGGNATGFANLTLDITFKRLEVLVSIAHGLKRIAHFLNPGNPIHEVQLRVIAANIGSLGMEVEGFPVATPAEIDAAFTSFKGRGIDSVSVGSTHS
jgi:putative ABC transport system substrate-binding protein